MAAKLPVFVDCHGELAERLTDGMLGIVPGIDVYRDQPRDEDELVRRLQGRRNALVYMGYMSERVLRACPGLGTIAYLSTGLSTHGDLETARELGTRIEGVSGYGDRAVAEHAVTLALAGLKRIAEMDRELRSNRWRLMRTEEFSRKTFGLIGLGGIGAETARIAHALGARVIGWTRSGNDRGTPAEMLKLADVLSQSDVLSLHLALNPATEGLLGADAFRRMKRGVVLVNTARAGIVEEKALVQALNDGTVGHAGLDVFHQEPIPPGNPLIGLHNVTLTPHSAWMTTQAIDRLLVAGLRLLARHIKES